MLKRLPIKEAVVFLQPVDGQVAPDPSVSRRMAESVLAQAHQETGLSPTGSNIMDQLHSFSVRAPQPYIDALARDKNVARVLDNSVADAPLIQPVRKRSVRLPD